MSPANDTNPSTARHLIFILVFIPLLAIAQTDPIQPGEYEITATIAVSNVAEEAIPDVNTRCITTEDLSNVDAVFNNRFMSGFNADPT